MEGPHKKLCCITFCSLTSSSSVLPSSFASPTSSSSSSSSSRREPESLLDLSAKVVALHVPFARIEERYDRIPEPVQRRIIYWSFPRNERDIFMYSSLSSSTSDGGLISGSTSSSSGSGSSNAVGCAGCADSSKLPFFRGLRLYESNAVGQVLQVGFHLSGVVSVKDSSSSSNSNSTSSNPSSSSTAATNTSRVSITFDRCKITSVTCTCSARDIFWCEHVVALALYRIRKAHLVKLRVPISETLLQLDRQQLQKLLQYMIAEHHTEVLPTAQKLADEILQSKSVINSIDGAPDPTSGPCAEAEHAWHLDEDQVSEQVRSFLCQGSQGISTAVKQLNALFGKVKEMLGAKDSNAARMLRLITEQFLADPRLPVWRSSQNTPMTDKCRILWDQLACLWVSVVLNPHATQYERMHWKSLLEKWSRLSICPLEDYEFSRATLSSSSLKRRISSLEESSDEEDEDSSSNHHNHNHHRYNRSRDREMNHGQGNSNNSSNNSSSSSSRRNLPHQPRSIFDRALEACLLRWDNKHLQYILEHDPKPVPAFNYHHHHFSNNSYSNSMTGGEFSSKGYPLWTEPIATAAARVEALRSHGYRREALRLAVTIVRTLKRKQYMMCDEWNRAQSRASGSSSNLITASLVAQNPSFSNQEGWIGNLLDPIGTLFDTLAEASLTPDSKHLDLCYGSILDCPSTSSPSSSSTVPGALAAFATANNSHHHMAIPLQDELLSLAAGALHPPGSLIPPHNHLSSSLASSSSSASSLPSSSTTSPSIPPRDRPRYQHLPVPSGRDRQETYLTLAVECSLIGLGQQRLMPSSSYAQEKAWKQEEKLILKLQDLELDSLLVTTLRKQAELLLTSGPSSGFGVGIHPESVPMHTFAKFLFTALLPHDVNLAYDIGLRAMRLPILEGIEDPDEASIGLHNNVLGRYPRLQPATLEHIQKQQCSLAETMLSAAKEDRRRLKDVFLSAQRNIHSSQQLYRLATDTFRIAVDASGFRYEHLLRTSYDIGLQVMMMTVNTVPWKRREMIKWMVNCATEVGLDALISIMEKWEAYFTPTEATQYVAGQIMSHQTVMRLQLDFAQQEKLSRVARLLAINCMSRDPSNCALTSLGLCENNQYDFSKAYELVTIAGAKQIMNPAQLFQIARYMEVKGLPDHAYKLALLAVKGVSISPNGESHQHINDIHWTCSMAYSLGKDKLAEIIPILVENIQCAQVLSEILKRCAAPSSTVSPPPSLHPSNAAVAAATALAGPSTSTLNPHHHAPPPTHPLVPHHHHHHHHHPHHPYEKRRSHSRHMPVDKPPLRQLLDAAIRAYKETTKARLMHISPRHYTDFIQFLEKAQETFKLSPDGQAQFASLLDNMKMVYKGKKKLMFLVKERFG